MPAGLAAKQMAAAYGACVLARKIEPSSHHDLLRADR
jgi:hypothetical protein